jgi:hypothetical protein
MASAPEGGDFGSGPAFPKPQGGGAPPIADYMAPAEAGKTPPSSWQSSGDYGTPIPETVQKQERENAQRVEAERQQRFSVAANISASPLEIVHRNGVDGSVIGNETIPLTAIPVPVGLGPRPPGWA